MAFIVSQPSSQSGPADAQSFEGLIDLLAQEEAIYREIGCLLDEEQTAMLRLEPSRLGELAARKETLGLRIKALDESRKILARRLALQLGLPSEAVTVTRLCEHAPAVLGARLDAAAKRLRATVLDCQSKNEINGRAAARGLDLVSGAMNYLIAQADPTGKVYQAGKTGGRGGGYATMSRTAGSGLISRKA